MVYTLCIHVYTNNGSNHRNNHGIADFLWYLLFSVCFVFFRTEFHCVAPVSLELTAICLPPPPMGWY